MILTMQGDGEVVVSRGEIGNDASGGAKVRFSKLNLAFLEQSGAEIVFGDSIVAGDLERVSEEADAVMPVSNLRVRDQHVRNSGQSERCSEEVAVEARARGGIRDEANDGDEHSKHGRLHVAIGQSLTAGL